MSPLLWVVMLVCDVWNCSNHLVSLRGITPKTDDYRVKRCKNSCAVESLNSRVILGWQRPGLS